jgi:hypothetical protein
MRQAFSYRRTMLTDCDPANPDIQTLFEIFRATLKPEMQFREFKAYFYSGRLEYIDVTFILDGRLVIGFCSAAFYTAEIGRSPGRPGNRDHTIGRAAIGIREQYRGRTLPKWKLYRKYVDYWLTHPLRRMILSAYVANPLVYAMICKYTGIAYPRGRGQVPEKIIRLKDALLRRQRLRAAAGHPFVVEIHFSVAMSGMDLERIYTSNDRNVRYFLAINPVFRQRHGVLVLIPVNGLNILLSSGLFLYYFFGKMIRLEFFRKFRRSKLFLNRHG